MNRVITTQAQRQKLFKSFSGKNWINSEKAWTWLVARLLVISKYRNQYLEMITGAQGHLTDSDKAGIWYECMPLSPRKGERGNTEGDSRIDLAFGGLCQRGKTKGGVKYETPPPMDMYGRSKV